MILCVRKRTFIRVANVQLDALWALLAISSKKENFAFFCHNSSDNGGM